MDALALREFDSLWDDFGDFYVRSEWTPSWGWRIFSENCGCFPNMDLVRGADHYTMVFELPGLTEKDFELEVKDRVMTIKGRYPEPELKDEELIVRERFGGEFSRSFELPDDVDGERIEASYKNGLLQVRLPRSQKAEEKRIKIEVH
jgi:HSP20 family protein